MVIFLLGPPGDHARFTRQGIATLLLAGNLAAYRYSGDYFSPNPNPLIHTWSLSVEEQIYIFLPIILILIVRNQAKIRKSTTITLFIITSISFISFLIPQIMLPIYSKIKTLSPDSLFSFYSPIDRIWQFTLGSLVFLLLDRHQSHIKQISKSSNLFVVIIFIIFLFSPIHVSLQVSSILASLFAVFVIVFKSLSVLPNILFKKLEWLGDRSYSIYLFHMPLLYIALYSPIAKIGSGENRIIQSAIAVIATILLGSMSYSKIENRYRNKGKSRFIKFKTMSNAFIITFVAPLALFALMEVGLKHQYWGLDRNTPQPAYTGLSDQKCMRNSENGLPCIYINAGATKTVLLIGDSHAGHISQAVVDVAKNLNWNTVVWAHSGCHVQFQRNNSSKVSDKCINLNKQMRTWVFNNKPSAIIVSQFVHSDSSQTDLKSALSTLHSIVPNILLIENIPIWPDEKDFMIPRPLFMSPYKAPKGYKQSMMQIKDKDASNQLANWARNNEITTMNFDSIFCNTKFCTRWLNNEWLYRDVSHFSTNGAELTIPKLTTFLERI
jgi:peptidoglycan/LPS O-acetylase OafA/YrhL